MKKKGGLDDFKLYYEDIPFSKRYKASLQKYKRSISKKSMGNNLRTGFAFLVPHIFQQFKVSDRPAILPNINDNKTMPKLPPTNKTKSSNKSRQDLV